MLFWCTFCCCFFLVVIPSFILKNGPCHTVVLQKKIFYINQYKKKKEIYARCICGPRNCQDGFWKTCERKDFLAIKHELFSAKIGFAKDNYAPSDLMIQFHEAERAPAAAVRWVSVCSLLGFESALICVIVFRLFCAIVWCLSVSHVTNTVAMVMVMVMVIAHCS